MNCKDMMQIPELGNILCLRAGETGLERSIRWIYFADCLQCVQSEYRMEDYIHGGEFVVLTNRNVTDDREKLVDLIGRMNDHGIAAVLWLFSFTTFLGILFYARSNVAYLFGDNWASQTAYKVVALVMLFIGGLATYTFVWDLGDVGIGLMTIFNMIALIPLSKQALDSLKDFESKKRLRK